MDSNKATATPDNVCQRARLLCVVCGLHFRSRYCFIMNFIKKCTIASMQRVALERCLKSYRLFSWKRSNPYNRQPKLLSTLAATETETELVTKICEIIKNNSLDSWKRFILYRDEYSLKYSIHFIE